jgi:sugar (pentulose or hexulose) kinase
MTESNSIEQPNSCSKQSADKSQAEQAVILSIDNGTQSVRALLYDLNGKLLAKSQVFLQAYISEQQGWAEQNADYFWEKLSESCQLLWLQPEVIAKGYKDKVVAVSLTTQRNSVVNLDHLGKPLRPVMLWLDQRLSIGFNKLPWYWRVIFTLIGQSKAIHYFQTKAQSHWIAQNQPEIWQKTSKFLFLSGFLIHQLTGQYKDSTASVVGYFPFDYKRKRWARDYDWKWQALNIKPQQLPELVEPGDTIGEITDFAAEMTGIKQGTPLIASASDKACEVLGSGCFEPSSASVSFGTTATLNINNKAYVEPQAFIPAFPSAIPEQYNSEVMVFRGFWMVEWFKQQFGLVEIQKAASLGVTTESLFDDLVNQVPAGSEGLILQPFWSPAIKNLEARGCLVGFNDRHTRAHVYRALLEGLVYALKEGKEKLEKRQKIKIEQLIISGGGSQSDAAMQLTADIFNLPVYRTVNFEASGLGAAINAAVGMEYYPDYPSAIKAMTHLKDCYLPKPENVATYQQLYEQVYKPLYKQLRPIYKKLYRLTH